MKSVSPTASPRTRGTVTLVALCFVTVMGITLAGYIAVCSRSMNLSNRTFHGNLSTKLPAAAGAIKEPLLVMNGGDDKFISAESITEFQNEMRSAKVDWQLVNFGGAVHCFAEPDEHGTVPGCQFHEPSYRRSVGMMHGFFNEAFARR